MMEAPSLNETAPAVTPYEIGTTVEIDAGRGSIINRTQAPSGLWWYEIEAQIGSGARAGFTRWHDEVALHPIDAAVMAIAAEEPINAGPTHDEIMASIDKISNASVDGLASALVTGGAPSLCGPECASHATIAAGFQALLDKGAAIIAAIDTIKPLDLVVLKSGGPQMIVEKIDGSDLFCWWMDHTANLHVARFPLGMLDLVPNFNHAELRA